MSLPLSAMNNSAPTRRIFMKFGIWVFLKNLLKKIQVCIIIIIIIIFTTIQLPLGGSSPYTSTDKTNKNKYT